MNILLVSNMYPNNKYPSFGIFVKSFAEELDKLNINYSKSVMFYRKGNVNKAFGYLKFYLITFFKALVGSYDIVYIHYASHSSAPVLAADRFRNLNIYTNVHGSDVVPENDCQVKMQKYTKAILARSCKVIVPSEYFKSYVKEKYNLDKEKLFVYPSGGINYNVFYKLSKEKKNNLKEQFGLKSEIPTFGMVGRISSGKGWDTFVEAVARAKVNKVKANFIIVGDGVEGEKLDALIKDLNVEESIVRIGMRTQDELCKYYNAIDFLVFPTKREGESLGLVAVEAMACGTPVIASDFAAPKYYIKVGVNGYKFGVGNVKELTRIIEFCAKCQTEEYVRLQLGAESTAREYRTDNVLRLLESIFVKNAHMNIITEKTR